MVGRWRFFGFLLGVALIVTCPAGRSALAGEILEKYEDGRTRVRYGVDDEGKKNGFYLEFHPNGQLAVRTSYRADAIDGMYSAFHENGATKAHGLYRAGRRTGKWEEWAEDKRPTLTAAYVDGRLHGRLEAFRKGRSVCVQVWDKGVLATMDGVSVHPRSLADVRKTLAAIAAGEIHPLAPAKPRGKGDRKSVV